MRKFLLYLILGLVAIVGIGVGVRYFFVVGKGVKGYVFKTYEGKLVQSGLKRQLSGVQSNEFEFSVTDEKVAQQLLNSSGKYLELHYKEYLGALPWRGMSRYVVDSIISISDPNTGQRSGF
jgi:hypothetical protein